MQQLHTKEKRRSIFPFRSVPFQDQTRCKTWIHFCRRKDQINEKNARICSNHFTKDDYERDLQHELMGKPPRKKLKPDAVPTVFCQRGHEPVKDDRTKRIQKREARKTVHEVLLTTCEDPDIPDEEVNASRTPLQKDEEVQVNLNIHDSHRILILEKTVEDLQKQLSKEKLNSSKLQVKVNKLKTENLRINLKDKENKTPTPFSATQQQRLRGKQAHWTTADIVRALSVRSVGIKAYETARKEWKIPLPCVRTLQRWASRFSCSEGLLEDVVNVMKNEANNLTDYQKICTIMFDEMNILSDYVLDKEKDKIVSHSKAQVVMVRGLCDNWKQPIYYGFDQKMTTAILFTIISTLENAGYNVVAVTSDLGPDNRTLMSKLGITKNKTFFHLPDFKEKKVYFFADIPHMMKLIRNHLVDDGIQLQDGTRINRATFQKLIEEDTGELKLCPKFSQAVLDVQGPERMRVRPAIQTLSHHVACFAKKVFPESPSISEFIELVNNSFDILNSRAPENRSNPIGSAFGLKLKNQIHTLNQLITVLESARFFLHGKLRKALLPCQNGFIISIKSTIQLVNDLKAKCNLTYILTARLNQDALESLFSSVRAFGGPNQNPTPPEFKYRLRLILLGSNLRCPKGTNAEYEDNTNIMSAKLLSKNQLFSRNLSTQSTVDKAMVVCEDGNNDEEALKYLAGYLAWKAKRKGKGVYGTPTRSNSDTSWISQISRGGLLSPQEDFMDWIEKCNECFKNAGGGGFVSNSSEKFLKQLSQLHPNIPLYIAKEFIALRLKIRTKFLNTHKISLRNKRKALQFLRSKKH